VIDRRETDSHLDLGIEFKGGQRHSKGLEKLARRESLRTGAIFVRLRARARSRARDSPAQGSSQAYSQSDRLAIPGRVVFGHVEQIGKRT